MVNGQWLRGPLYRVDRVDKRFLGLKAANKTDRKLKRGWRKKHQEQSMEGRGTED